MAFMRYFFLLQLVRIRVSFNVFSWGFGLIFISLILLTLVYSFSDPGKFFEHWQNLFLQEGFLQTCLRSFSIAIIVTLGCLLVGFPMALWVSELPRKHRFLVVFLITLPHWTGLLIKTSVILYLIDPIGPAIGLLDMRLPVERFTHAATATALFYVYLPFMVLPLYASIRYYSLLAQGDKERAPLYFTHPSRVFFSTTRPGMIIGSILVFIPCLGTLIVPAVLGPPDEPLIGVSIASYLRDVPQSGSFLSAASTIILVILTLLILYLAHGQRTPMEEEGAVRQEKNPLLKKMVPVFGFFGLGLIYFPILVLFSVMPSVFLEGMRSIWFDERHAFLFAAGNSFVIALIAATVASWVAALCEYRSQSHRHAGHRQATSPFRWPLMLPELVTGMAVLVPFLWFGRGGGMVVLIIAHCIYCVPFAHVPIVARLHYDIDHHKTDRLPGIIAGFLLAFVISLDNFTITNLIWDSDQPVTLPLFLYHEVKGGMTAQGHTLASLLLLLSLCFVAMSWRIGHLGIRKKPFPTG